MGKYTEDDLREELKLKNTNTVFIQISNPIHFLLGLNEDIVRAISKKKEEPRMDDRMETGSF